ncbi:MAG: hypothetical protein MUF75_06415 [Bacteroidia bacterium]|nr:hypothetical protein [Bacteroidia bacterium]
MKNETEILFEEKQYLGHNRLSISIRTLLAIFCFTAYYWSENPNPVQVSFFTLGSYPIKAIDNSGLIFFVLGISLLLLSSLLTFVLHTHIKVFRDYLVIDGFWTSRRVKIEFRGIKRLRKSRYKKNSLRRAVYNLHNLGIIRFYTSGEEFVEISDREGFTYRIGSQRAAELHKILKEQIKINSENV